MPVVPPFGDGIVVAMVEFAGQTMCPAQGAAAVAVDTQLHPVGISGRWHTVDDITPLPGIVVVDDTAGAVAPGIVVVVRLLVTRPVVFSYMLKSTVSRIGI